DVEIAERIGSRIVDERNGVTDGVGDRRPFKGHIDGRVHHADARAIAVGDRRVEEVDGTAGDGVEIDDRATRVVHVGPGKGDAAVEAGEADGGAHAAGDRTVGEAEISVVVLQTDAVHC